MAYTMYIDDIVMPVMPGAISYQTANKNETIELISGKEINIPKPEGLLTLSFDLLLPGVEYPFAYYADGLKSPSYFLDHFKKLKASQKPFQLIIARVVGTPETYKRGEVKDLNWTNMKVAMEDYPQEESAENGYDIKVSVTLKQWSDYATKAYQIEYGDDTGGTNTGDDGEEIEEPTLTVLLPERMRRNPILYPTQGEGDRSGLPDGFPQSSTAIASTDRALTESSRTLMASRTSSVSRTSSGAAAIVLRSDAGTRTTTSENLLKATLVSNKIGVINYSVSGVLIDVDDNSGGKFVMHEDQDIFGIMASRFGLSRAQTANVTKNGVTRYGLFSIVNAFVVGSGLLSLWDIKHNVEYQYSAVSQGLKQFVPVLVG